MAEGPDYSQFSQPMGLAEYDPVKFQEATRLELGLELGLEMESQTCPYQVLSHWVTRWKINSVVVEELVFRKEAHPVG